MPWHAEQLASYNPLPRARTAASASGRCCCGKLGRVQPHRGRRHPDVLARDRLVPDPEPQDALDDTQAHHERTDQDMVSRCPSITSHAQTLINGNPSVCC